MNDNKLIGDFMDIRNTGLSIYAPHEYQYHTSWDWLMPAVSKCLVGEAEQSAEISNTTIKNIYEAICNQDILDAHKSVVQFIKAQNND